VPAISASVRVELSPIYMPWANHNIWTCNHNLTAKGTSLCAGSVSFCVQFVCVPIGRTFGEGLLCTVSVSQLGSISERGSFVYSLCESRSGGISERDCYYYAVIESSRPQDA
jgi:hypothetical protein